MRIERKCSEFLPRVSTVGFVVVDPALFDVVSFLGVAFVFGAVVAAAESAEGVEVALAAASDAGVEVGVCSLGLGAIST